MGYIWIEEFPEGWYITVEPYPIYHQNFGSELFWMYVIFKIPTSMNCKKIKE